MIKIPPCDLPMVPLVPMVPMVPLAAESVQGFLVTIGTNGTNSTIGRFADVTTGRTPNVASDIVENFFCQQRTICHGTTSNPNALHFYVTLVKNDFGSEDSLSDNVTNQLSMSSISTTVSHLHCRILFI